MTSLETTAEGSPRSCSAVARREIHSSTSKASPPAAPAPSGASTVSRCREASGRRLKPCRRKARRSSSREGGAMAANEVAEGGLEVRERGEQGSTLLAVEEDKQNRARKKREGERGEGRGHQWPVGRRGQKGGKGWAEGARRAGGRGEKRQWEKKTKAEKRIK